MNDAFDGQFINEANITNGVSKTARPAEEPCISVAVNRYVKQKETQATF